MSNELTEIRWFEHCSIFQIFLFPECSLASQNHLESSLSISSLAGLHLVAFVEVPRSLHLDCRWRQRRQHPYQTLLLFLHHRCLRPRCLLLYTLHIWSSFGMPEKMRIEVDHVWGDRLQWSNTESIYRSSLFVNLQGWSSCFLRPRGSGK